MVKNVNAVNGSCLNAAFLGVRKLGWFRSSVHEKPVFFLNSNPDGWFQRNVKRLLKAFQHFFGSIIGFWKRNSRYDEMRTIVMLYCNFVLLIPCFYHCRHCLVYIMTWYSLNLLDMLKMDSYEIKRLNIQRQLVAICITQTLHPYDFPFIFRPIIR